MLHRLREKPVQWWMLAAACAAVMLGTFVVLNTDGSAGWALLLAWCPAMHILLHRFMLHTGHETNEDLKGKPVDLPPVPHHGLVPQQRSGNAERRQGQA